MSEDKDETYVRPHRRKNKKKKGTHKVKGHTRKKPGKRSGKPRGGSCKGGSDFDETRAEYDGRPEALEEKIEELVTEEGYTNQEVVNWLSEHNLLDEAKYTEFWDVVIKENPMMTKETLEAYLETEEGEEFLENHWEALHEIPMGGAVKGHPYWLNHIEGREPGESVKLTDSDIVAHQMGFSSPLGQNGGTVEGSRLNSHYDGDAFDPEKEYKYIGGTKGDSELELQAEDGGLVYKHIGSNFFNAYRPVED